MDTILVKKKPHPMDACRHCNDPRFLHEGKIPLEDKCLMKGCLCMGFEWDTDKA